MARRVAVLVSVLLLAVPAAAQAASPWDALGKRALAARGTAAAVETAPERFAAFALDRAQLERSLASAPLERTRRSDTVVSIPDPRGRLVRFRVVESPVMEPGLAARHPEIRTYAGRGVDDPSTTVRFDVTPLGFHASARGDGGAWYVDPYYRRSQAAYVAYERGELADAHGPFREGAVEAVAAAAPPRRAGEAVTARVYRLALISDPTYADYFGSANVTAAKATLINRVDQIYNDDLAVRMDLIDQTDDLNLDTEAKYREFGLLGGGCGLNACYPPGSGDQCDSATIGQNAIAINGALGDPSGSSYDIGHLVLGKAGGGIAGVGVVQGPRKAEGCTGIPTPVGDAFAVDYVAHEMGHQFGANHTFNGTQSNCSGSSPPFPSGNRNDATAVEPGSGSSVMSYAGICRQDNLQPHSDPYFHQRSIDEITGFTASSAPGDTSTVTVNRVPVVTAPDDVTIPVRTPFTLAGSATDADGNPLTYLWQQDDAGTGTPLVSNDKPGGPLFRVFSRYAPVTGENTLLSPSPGENVATSADAARTFPDPAQIVTDNTNAATGRCADITLVPDDDPAPPPVAIDDVECFSEFLPTSPRTLTFRLTARDGVPGGGGVASDDVKVAVVGSAPFRVTSAPATAAPGESVPVTWDVAGTAGPPVDATQVRISYSTDGGQTFPTVLAGATPNDGQESVTLPPTPTSTGRFKVEALGNVFFDISHADLTVSGAPAGTPPDTPGGSPTATPSGSASPGPGPAAPARAFVRPDLRLTRKRQKVTRKRTFVMVVRCRVGGGEYAIPRRCKGSVRAGAAKRRKLSLAVAATTRIRFRVSRRAYRRLRAHPRTVTVRATLGGRTATKKITLRR